MTSATWGTFSWHNLILKHDLKSFEWNRQFLFEFIWYIRDVLFEFHLKFWNTASIGIPVRSKVDRLLSALTAQQKGTTARWY